METTPTDEGLVLDAQRGEVPAFEELIRRTTRLVYARIYLDIGEAHKTEDLVQETFLTAYRSIGQVAAPAGFRAWLLTIAQTATLDHFRREGRKRRSAPPRVNESVLDRTEGGEAPPDEKAEVEESQRKVRAILQSLPEAYRLPLTLRFIDGEDYEAISMQLGLTNGSLRGLLNRGMHLLREQAVRALGPEMIGGRR